jgi:hypothetical protein
MNGPQERYDRSNDTAAKMIAFLSPYLFWVTIGSIAAAILLLNS